MRKWLRQRKLFHVLGLLDRQKSEEQLDQHGRELTSIEHNENRRLHPMILPRRIPLVPLQVRPQRSHSSVVGRRGRRKKEKRRFRKRNLLRLKGLISVQLRRDPWLSGRNGVVRVAMVAESLCRRLGPNRLDRVMTPAMRKQHRNRVHLVGRKCERLEMEVNVGALWSISVLLLGHILMIH